MALSILSLAYSSSGRVLKSSRSFGGDGSLSSRESLAKCSAAVEWCRACKYSGCVDSEGGEERSKLAEFR